MADPGTGDPPRSNEPVPATARVIVCAVCSTGQPTRTTTPEGVQRCRICGYPLWATREVLARIGGDFVRLFH